VQPEARRELLSGAITSVMHRIGGLDRDVEIVAAPDDDEGLRWRTRVRYSVGDDGRLGFHRHRSASVAPVARCFLATDAVAEVGVTQGRWTGARAVSVVGSSAGDLAVVIDADPTDRRRLAGQVGRDAAVLGVRGSARVREVVLGRDLVVAAGGFWQGHRAAPELLVTAVREALRPQEGDHLLDLYSGAGLFAASLADDVGTPGRIDAVEHDAAGCAAARRNVHDLPQVRVHEARVDRWLASGPESCDLVVLDPPESGAGSDVVARIVALRPRSVAYVSCGPASLARDIATFRTHGWDIESLRAYELFGSTQHVECLAVLSPVR
jgi:tRNA/tmRNA/rRNA uracil-C5-methylase (TrmA/RlmC/RlmD family)